MLEFISANMATIIVAALVAVLVGLIVVRMVRDRRRGVSSCGNACACCPNAALCHAHQPPKASPDR